LRTPSFTQSRQLGKDTGAKRHPVNTSRSNKQPLICIADRLRDAGYSVIEAGDAVQAIDVLHRDDAGVELVFSDIQMPGSLDGVALARLVREQYPIIKVVLTSGRFATLDWIEHDGFFQKPYEADEVIEHVGQLLGGERTNGIHLHA
jgi:CheY-like chemotaxis protein